MYQYMNKLHLELFAKVKAPLQNTNYRSVDDFIVNSRNVTLYYGSYECSAPGKQAFMDSWFSCFLFQLPFFIEKIQLGWIGFVFVLPIMLISIFGRIKESYKWFILHQAIWDAFLCYDFICAKPTLFGWSFNAFPQQTTYSIPPIMFLLSNICAGFLFYKIASQLKFQLKTNPESFKQTIKIISVIGFQCLTMSLIFLITGIQKFMQIKSQIFDTFVFMMTFRHGFCCRNIILPQLH